MGLLTVLFWTLGHHFVLVHRLQATAELALGLQGAEGKVGMFAVGAGGVSVLGTSGS